MQCWQTLSRTVAWMPIGFLETWSPLDRSPCEWLKILSKLPNVRLIRGNTDRYVAFGDRPSPSIDEAQDNLELLDALVEVANTFSWTQGMLTAAGWLDWLRDLQLDMRCTLPDGTRFLGVHASPGRDDGSGIVPNMDTTELRSLLTDCRADLVCVGHTHRPSEQRIDGGHIVNLGAVSLSVTEDKHASYVLLDAQQDGYSLAHRSIAYNRAAVIDQLKRIGHPGRGYLIKHLSD